MKNVLKLFLAVTVIFILASCQKDDLNHTVITEGGGKIEVPTVLSFSDQAKMQVAKWVAHACNENEPFKKMLLQSILDIETGNQMNYFFSTLLTVGVNQAL